MKKKREKWNGIQLQKISLKSVSMVSQMNDKDGFQAF